MIFHCIIIFWIIIDLISKYWSNNFLSERVDLLGDFLYLQHIKNDGIAFSIDVPFLKVVTIVLILGIFYYYFNEERSKQSKLLDTSFGLILAWAIWNGIERIWFGEVTDFIGVQGFAIFNLADSFITIGAIVYIYYTYTSWVSDRKK